jgi:hypothetical protein
MRLSKLAAPEFKSALHKLMEAPLPVKTTFRLKKLVVALEAELKIFEETRELIVRDFGEKSEDGQLKFNEQGMIKLDISRASEWQPKLAELMMLESSIDIPKLTLSDFGETLQLSANELFALGDVISEE